MRMMCHDLPGRARPLYLGPHILFRSIVAQEKYTDCLSPISLPFSITRKDGCAPPQELVRTFPANISKKTMWYEGEIFVKHNLIFIFLYTFLYISKLYLISNACEFSELDTSPCVSRYDQILASWSDNFPEIIFVFLFTRPTNDIFVNEGLTAPY